MRTLKRTLQIAVIVSVLTVAACAGPRPAAESEPAAPVSAAEVSVQDTTSTTDTGTIAPLDGELQFLSAEDMEKLRKERAAETERNSPLNEEVDEAAKIRH